MTHNPEARKQIGESSKVRWADPEYRKQQSESRRQAWVSRKAEWARKAELATTKLKCENCGEQFAPMVVRRGSNAQKYCSENCRDTAYMRRKRTKPEYQAKVRERWANDPEFRESRVTASRRWRERHPEKAKAASQHWVSNNRGHLAEYARERRKRNPESYREYQRARYRRLVDAARRGQAALAGRTATKTHIFAEAARLHSPKISWSKLALKLLPTECKSRGVKKVGESLRQGATNYLKTQGATNAKKQTRS